MAIADCKTPPKAAATKILNPISPIRNWHDLPPIDRLEGFRPGGRSMYQRVIVAVLYGRTSVPAWTYWMPRIDTGIRLGSGVWHRPF